MSCKDSYYNNRYTSTGEWLRSELTSYLQICNFYLISCLRNIVIHVVNQLSDILIYLWYYRLYACMTALSYDYCEVSRSHCMLPTDNGLLLFVVEWNNAEQVDTLCTLSNQYGLWKWDYTGRGTILLLVESMYSKYIYLKVSMSFNKSNIAVLYS